MGAPQRSRAVGRILLLVVAATFDVACTGVASPPRPASDAATPATDAVAGSSDGGPSLDGGASLDGDSGLCTTTGRLICDASLVTVRATVPVVVGRGVGAAPSAQGGVPVPGVYQLVSETFYGDPPADIVYPHVGGSIAATLSVSCDVFNIVYTNGNYCGRLVPHDLGIADLVAFTGVGTVLDETPYTATANTLTLLGEAPYRDLASFEYLGSYTIADVYVLESALSGWDAGSPNVAAPNPSGGRDPRCPTQTPAAGDPCNPQPAPLECEYGGDALGQCTTVAKCVLQPDATFAFAIAPAVGCAPNPAGCPASYALAFATAGPDAGACTGTTACSYPEGVCGCGSTSSASAWTCRARGDVSPESPDGGACPAQRPLLGDGCAVDEWVCNYASPCAPDLSLGPALACINGYWEELDGVTSCPEKGP